MIDRLQRVDAGHAAKLETQDDGFVVLTSVTHILTNQHKIRPESSAQEWENICSLYLYFNFHFVYSITSFYGLEFFFLCLVQDSIDCHTQNEWGKFRAR